MSVLYSDIETSPLFVYSSTFTVGELSTCSCPNSFVTAPVSTLISKTFSYGATMDTSHRSWTSSWAASSDARSITLATAASNRSCSAKATSPT